MPGHHPGLATRLYIPTLQNIHPTIVSRESCLLLSQKQNKPSHAHRFIFRSENISAVRERVERLVGTV